MSAPPPPRNQPLFWLLALPVVIFICAMVWLIHNLYTHAEEREQALKQANALEYSLTRIQYLGEILPMYPIITATTLSERQYHATWHKELDDLFAQLWQGQGLASSLSQQAVSALSSVHAQLRATEIRVFDLQAAGEFSQAKQLLEDSEYVSNRMNFRQTVENLLATIRQSYQQALEADTRAIHSAILSLLILLLLLTFVWFSLLRRLHQVHLTLIETDIELHQQKEALEASEARLSAMYNTVIDGIVSIDEKGTIEFVNPAMEKIFGYSEAELVGHNVSMLMPEPDSSQHDSYLQRYLDSGEKRVVGISRRVTAKRKDGSEFTADLEVAEMFYGSKHRFSGLIRDLSCYLNK